MLARVCPGPGNAFVQTGKSLLLTHTAPGLMAHLVKHWLDFNPSLGTPGQGIRPTPVRDGSGARTLLQKARRTKSPSAVPGAGSGSDQSSFKGDPDAL